MLKGNDQYVVDLAGSELHLLRVFGAVVECKGFSAASQTLGLARPTISLHMAALERRLGLRLCWRGKGGFGLTPAGLKIHRESKLLLAAAEQFVGRVNLVVDEHFEELEEV